MQCTRISAYAVAWLWLLNISRGHILRLNCGTLADFSIKGTGKKITTGFIARFKHVERHDCYKRCLGHSDCKAVNIASAQKVCELVSVSPTDKRYSVSTKSLAEWEYHTTNHSSITVGPNCRKRTPICKSDEMCIQTCDCPGFLCISCRNKDTLGHFRVHCNRYCDVYNHCKNGGE